MKHLRRFFYCVVITGSANLFTLLFLWEKALQRPFLWWQKAAAALVCTVLTLVVLIAPQREKRPTRRLQMLSNGCELICLFLISTILTAAIQILAAVWTYRVIRPGETAGSGAWFFLWLLGLLIAVLVESAAFWCGVLRLYASSAQLGIRHRVLAVLFAWIPGLNLYYLVKMIRIVSAETALETERYRRDAARAGEMVCRTRYPILLVHGVFFRDFRYLNYWGRIPEALQKNGATVYYGEQQSAAPVEDCGAELAARIRRIVQETGCGKVNIIAHSKGGLDSRAAISHFGAASCVASLTTINTPHRGCIFAGYLLEKVPEKARCAIAGTYNAALSKLGDTSPDFLGAVRDLTATACRERNKTTPDDPNVLYESVMSYCKKARSGRFPLNVSYPLVKRFDGKNDGLVAVDSARWGDRFTLVEPQGRRGISHGDMIDLNRENIPGFDVREFYVSLVQNLKERGY